MVFGPKNRKLNTLKHLSYQHIYRTLDCLYLNQSLTEQIGELSVYARPYLIAVYVYDKPETDAPGHLVYSQLCLQYILLFLSFILLLSFLPPFTSVFALLQISKPCQACLLFAILCLYLTVPYEKY